MKTDKHRYIISIITLLLLFFVNGCKEKGCTDPNAINYNSIADEDDGSCITCKSTTDTLGTLTGDLYDNNFSSPHYNQAVATFTLIQLKNNFTYSECGTNDCFFKVKIESHVPEKMSFTFNLQINGNVFISWIKNVVVQPNSTIYTEKIPANSVSNPCGDISFSSLFLSTSGVIIYN